MFLLVLHIPRHSYKLGFMLFALRTGSEEVGSTPVRDVRISMLQSMIGKWILGLSTGCDAPTTIE